MNNASKVEAFKTYYSQAKKLYASDDLENARTMFLNAASLANELSLEATTYDVRMEYHALAEKILKFVKNDFGKKAATSVGKEPKPAADSDFLARCAVSGERVTFSDVAGLQEAKDEIIYNVIEPLKNPEIAAKYKIAPGAKILLYGPPGTGKTFIARAVAGEIDAKFYSVNCQDLISKYMGESSKQIDALFEEAQKNERAIIFFDEFDSIASRRESGGGAVDSEMARFVASFLTKVDGFKKPDTCKMLLLIAATNRPWAIDPAMLRGGRFDIHIYIDLPDYESRKFLISKEFYGLSLDGTTIEELAIATQGYGGADIVAACRKMRQLAYRREISTGAAQSITRDDASAVMTSLRPSTTQDELDLFASFRKGDI